MFSSGAATDKAWIVLKPRKSPRKIPARSGKGSSQIKFYWSPRCLQRLHAWGNDAWRSKSRLTSRHVVSGSFCVKGRSCAIDVCWEGKKFRVICSHLNPGSVMHMCAGDLEDLRSLVTSRMKDAHVHVGVGAQTGAWDRDTWDKQPKHWYCYNAIIGHLSTATNTFSNDDDRNANILTCNYNGRHEPQQIDYILSSDNSLRSRTFDSSTTVSDHCVLTATINPKRGKTPGKRHARKPKGWECRDHIGFNNTVRAHVNVGQWTFCSGAAAQRHRILCTAHFHRWISP